MGLSDEERIIYLANVVSMARTDGSLSPRETDAIEKIQKRLGAKKSELNKASKLAEASDYKIQPVGHFADKVQNLEDLIYVSIVDGIVDKREKPVILTFAKDITLSKEQLNSIIKDVKRSLASGTAQLKCPSCGFDVAINARFCPHCGASVKEVDSEKAMSVSYEIPNSGIAIEFAESTAGGFVHAVEVAKSAPINATCVKGKRAWYLAAYPSSNIVEATKLVENLKGMQNRKVYVDGLDEKRFNIWGCKQVRMDWSEWADWFSYGSFKKTGLLKGQASFVFDKNRIKHELQTNLFRFRYCPYLNFDLIEAVLDKLPSEVNPSEKGPWVYKKDYSESPGSIKVKVKAVEDGYMYTDEFFSSGVAPKNPYLGLQILKQALKAGGISDMEIKGVLSFKDF
jgi:endogenous inhibitor of DNA gyrase (YacG/DUF329 family)